VPEIQVDIGITLEVIEGLRLRHHKEERRGETIGEDLRRKVQSHTGQEDNVKSRQSQGQCIVEKLHHRRGAVRDLLNLCKEENNCWNQDQAEFETTRLIHLRKEGEQTVHLQLAVIITCLVHSEIIAAGNAQTLGIDDLHPSTEPFHHGGRHPFGHDQAREENLLQSTRTFQVEIDATRHIRLPVIIEIDLGHHPVDVLALLYLARSLLNITDRPLENYHPTPLACRRQSSRLRATPIEKIQTRFLSPDAAAAHHRDETIPVIERTSNQWTEDINITKTMACIITCIEATRGHL
jgi:hypothetical protein